MIVHAGMRHMADAVVEVASSGGLASLRTQRECVPYSYEGRDSDVENTILGTKTPLESPTRSRTAQSLTVNSVKLSSSEWCDDRNDIVELKELGERGLHRQSPLHHREDDVPQ